MARKDKQQEAKTTTPAPEASLARGDIPTALLGDASEAIGPTQLAHLVVYDWPWNRVLLSARNHNEHTDAQFKATVESILHHGYIDPSLVRPLSDSELTEHRERSGGKDFSSYREMIDGEHRLRGLIKIARDHAKEQMHDSTRSLIERKVIPVLSVPMTKEWADHLRIVLTFGGTPNYRKLGDALSALEKELGGLDKLQLGIPWDSDHLREIISAGTFDWEQHQKDLEHKSGANELTKLFTAGTIKVPKDKRDQLEQGMRALALQLGGKLTIKDAK